MATLKRSPRGKLRSQQASAYSLDDVVQETFRLWRKHHLGYDQTKYVVERVRRYRPWYLTVSRYGAS